MPGQIAGQIFPVSSAVQAALQLKANLAGSSTQPLNASTITASGLITAQAGVAATGAVSATTTLRTGGFTVATLPAGTVGDRAYVTDATTPTYNGALVGGGAVVVPVFRNATAWVSA